MRPRKPYKGVLRRRLPAPDSVPMDEWLTAAHERIIALADHYGFDWRKPGVAETLIAMGQDHVEGFQVSAGKGGKPPDPRQTARDIVLFVEVLKSRQAGEHDAAAYRRLAKRWAARDRGTGRKTATVTALRRRFNELSKPTTAAFRMWKTVFGLTSAQDENSVSEPLVSGRSTTR